MPSIMKSFKVIFHENEWCFYTQCFSTFNFDMWLNIMLNIIVIQIISSDL